MEKKESKKDNSAIDKIIALCKRRGFIFPGSEIYGGLANSWDYGPMGVELKNNIKQLWWETFVKQREDMVGIDAALIMNPKVWKASGHLDNFSDPLVECKKCHSRFRADHVKTFLKDEKSLGNMEKVMQLGIDMDNEKVFNANKDEIYWPCEKCQNKNFGTEPRQFNLMLKTFLGPAEEKANEVYFRPETAQAMFVNFKNVMDSVRPKLPFGIAQIGKAFRNEITPGNFIFRTREFEQMEIEYFIAEPKNDLEWQEKFEYWMVEMKRWMEMIGIDPAHIHELDVPKDELAHYSKRTMDFEYDFPFGRKELYGLAYRTNFDLKNHSKASGEELQYKEEGGEAFYPHVIEPTFGVDRSVLAVLCDSYTEEGERTYLKIKPQIAPFKAAVFPLLRNKPELVALAREIYTDLKKDINVLWDDRGNIGKRYYAQDEIGTPYCITVDFETLEGKEKFVTVRDRDTMKQEKVKASDLKAWLKDRIN